MRCRAGGAGRETERDGRMAPEEGELREQTIAQIAGGRYRGARAGAHRRVGKAGTLTGYLSQMGQIAKEERAAVGKTANEVRAVVEGSAGCAQGGAGCIRAGCRHRRAAAVDVTLPGRSQQVARATINRITDEISEIFSPGYIAGHA